MTEQVAGSSPGNVGYPVFVDYLGPFVGFSYYI